jgi:hypothetical protein
LLAFALPGASLAPPVALSAQGTPARLDVEGVCGQCHAFEVVTRTHRTRQQWQVQVEAMIAKGASVADDDIDRVVEYLTAHFGPTAAP